MAFFHVSFQSDYPDLQSEIRRTLLELC